jgi:hypothetical protein
MANFSIGDRVTVDHPKYPGVWTVRKVNPANLKLDQDGQRGISAPKSMCRPAEPGDGTPRDVTLPPAVLPSYGRADGLRKGAVVRFTRYWPREHGPGQLYVVIKDDYSTVNVTLLGGDPGRRYWRAIAPSWLEVIDPARVRVDLDLDRREREIDAAIAG